MSIRTRWLQNYDRDTDALTDASLLSAAPTSTTGFVGSAADDQVCLLGVQVSCGFGCVAVVWVGSGGRLWPNASVFWVVACGWAGNAARVCGQQQWPYGLPLAW